MTPAIELHEVHKRYGTVTTVHALQNVSLTIDAGELVSIVGPSGSGKTTLLHVMGALLRPTSGTVRIAGTPTSCLSDPALSALRAYELGFVFQDYVLTPGASALENVADGLLYCGVSRRERLQRAKEQLDRVGLAARDDPHPDVSFPAASASALRSPAHSSATRRSCSPTSQPGTSTARQATQSSNCSHPWAPTA